jgi:hypothetical protein
MRDKAHVFVGISIARRDEAEKIARHFERHGFPTVNLTGDELAKEHVRHMVGGRSELARDERLFRFEFPERPGALMRFLSRCTRTGTSACSTTATRAPTTAASWSAVLGRGALMAWNIEIDEAMFLGGLDKSAFLREFEPDFFFDDQIGHCESARVVTATGHVLSGIVNAS